MSLNIHNIRCHFLVNVCLSILNSLLFGEDQPFIFFICNYLSLVKQFFLDENQVPQYLLDYMWDKGEACKIICTQPRRISAISGDYYLVYIFYSICSRHSHYLKLFLFLWAV